MCELKTTELRIGNYIKYGADTLSVKQFTEKTILLNSLRDTLINIDSESAEPIQLTEEWLVNFGFEKKSYFTKGIVIECVYYQLVSFVVYLLPYSFEVEIINKSGDQFNLFKNWDYVHELQNVYYLFNQNELTHKKIN